MNIEYIPFATEQERKSLQHTLAIGNLVIESVNQSFLSTKKGYAKLHQCRMEILAHRTKVTSSELQAVQAVEDIKFRFIQAHIAKLRLIVRNKIKFARFYQNHEEETTLKRDLLSEAVIAALHAVYTYTDDQNDFMHFMTTVVYNRLGEYMAKSYPVIALDNISDLISAYHTARHELIHQGKRYYFEDVVKLMLEKELNEIGVEPTEEALRKRLKKRAKKYRILSFAIKKLGTVEQMSHITSPAEVNHEEFVEDLDNVPLTTLQRACLTAKTTGKSLRKLAKELNCNAYKVRKEFRKVKRLLQPIA